MPPLLPQIQKEAEALLAFHPYKTLVSYGGTNIQRCGGVPVQDGLFALRGCVWLWGGPALTAGRSADIPPYPSLAASPLQAAHCCRPACSERNRLAARCDVLVATPGRLIDHLENSGLAAKLQGIRTLVRGPEHGSVGGLQCRWL